MNVRTKASILSCLLALSYLLSSGPLMAQPGPSGYESKWKAVDSLSGQKGLTESALAVVNGIYAQARRENNDAQMIRALIYRGYLSSLNHEDAEVTSVKELEKEIGEARQPVKSVLQSVLAGVFRTYFQQVRWRLYQRTQTVHFDKSDMTTWALGDFFTRISDLYLASIKEEKLLQSIKLDAYEPILIKGNTRNLRPTLFDLLAHQALEYFKSSEQGIQLPASVFEVDDPAVFADAGTFAGHTFHSDDSLSLHFKALQLFQQLIRMHLSDPAPDALLDVDIERISFANQNSVMEDKDSLYMEALTRLTDRYGLLPVVAQAWFLQAQQHMQQAGNFDPAIRSVGDSMARYENGLALSICQKILAEKDSSEGKKNCDMLRHTILQKQLQIQTERVNLPNQPLHAMITWCNFDHLYLRLMQMDNSENNVEASVALWNNDALDKILDGPAYRSFTQVLPDPGDHRTHRTEIGIGSLPPGAYVLVASSSPDWSRKEGIISAQYMYVSTIAFVSYGRDYFVLNRESGQPFGSTNVQVWELGYNQNTRKPEMVRKESYVTDQSGHFLMTEKQSRDYTGKVLDIRVPGDRFFPKDGVIFDNTYSVTDSDSLLNKDEFEKKYARTFFFLDRSIYRPGQTVYFKGIVITNGFDTRQPKVLAGLPARIILYNTNGEKVDSLEVTTNEFGSYHGTFRLPEGGLNGKFHIAEESSGNSQYFSVEEYKRPRFYIEYEKVKGSYRLGDSVRVTGDVKGYAGNVIDGAKVRYRVMRTARFPYHWLFWQRVAPGVQTREIAHGEIKTGVDGKFSVVFAAIPDRSVSPALHPEFEYNVMADITDINGETRSGTTTVPAAYTVVKLAAGLTQGDHLPSDGPKTLSVTAANLSGEPIAAVVHIVVYPLQSPQRLIHQRLGAGPDLYVLSEKEFLDSFPHDEYRHETRKEGWARGGKTWDTTLTVAAGSQRLGDVWQKKPDNPVAQLPAGIFVPGWYVIEATTVDKYGGEVKDLQYVELYDSKTGQPGSPQYNWDFEQGPAAEPGEKALTSAGTSAANVFVIRKIVRAGVDRNAGAFSSYTLNKDKKTTEWPITEADRGGFGVWDVFVKDNRLYTHLSIVKVPWTNKELQIHYASFRDKTEPGSEEKWRVTISGYRKEQMSAEILSAMYDASLDQFAPHNWVTPPLYPTYTIFSAGNRWNNWSNFQLGFSQNRVFDKYVQPAYFKKYDQLLSKAGVRVTTLGESKSFRAPAIANDQIAIGYGTQRRQSFQTDSSVMAVVSPEKDSVSQPPVQVRKNLQETAFFFPDLRTDSAGNVSFSFTMPEALTTWKWMMLAHTKDLAFGYSERSVVTQKQLMVQPNAPRFLREGDRVEFSVKVANLTDSEMTGQMALQLTDPTTGQTADGWFTNRQPNQYFTVGARQSAVVSFPLDIPFNYTRPLTYRIVAQARQYSDGEEATLPVVSNRMLVTESLPLNMPGDGTRHFTLDKLLQSGSSETISHHALTVEFTANPAWYAVQALPYLMEYPYECAEQTFNRFYANALAEKIVSSSPRLRQVFSSWKTTDTAALLSNLQKNQELKSILLEETPWVLQGKTEEQQKKNIALLFDMDRMGRELASSLDKLKDMQSPGGGFVWFKGGPEDRYMTQYVLTGIGHLQKLNAVPASMADKIKEIVTAALPFLDKKIREDYDEEMKRERQQPAIGKPAGRRWIGELPVQYLYMRSLFNDYGIPGNIFPAVNYYRKQAQQLWVQSSKYMQGMIALALFRTGDVQTAKDIIASLRQNAIRDEEKGMYWKGMEGGYYWYQAPIEIQSLLIEAFHEISGDASVGRDLKTWLLKQKQTHNWPTTKATADACYALLLNGTDWLSAERDVEVRLGDKTIEWGGPAGAGGANAGEAGTGYYKKIFDGPFVNPAMGNITVTMRTAGAGKTGAVSGAGVRNLGSPAWGAVYWQYFDNLDRITPTGGHPSALKLVKKLFIERNTGRGPVLEPLAENGTLKVGDKVRVRIELQADRDLEYVHMKDMRAACMEPVDVISGYKWQGGLGYYESTKDVSTDFFFSWFPRGTYVFEYSLFAGQAGNFSNGITTIGCMYAPEFTYHSEGIRVNVEAAP